jgi:hypothetical protein
MSAVEEEVAHALAAEYPTSMRYAQQVARSLATAGLLKTRELPSRDEVHDAIWDAGLSRFLGVTDVERDVDAATDAVLALLRGENDG